MKFRTTLKLLSASIAAVGMAAAAQAADIKLGFAAPLTGPQSHYGEDMQNGLNLALEEANQKGIQIDGKPAKFVLVSRDDQADPRVGVQVAQQLVDESVVGILGHFNSGTTIPLRARLPRSRPAADRHGDLARVHQAGLRNHLPHDDQRHPAGRRGRQVHGAEPEGQEGRHHRRPHRLRPGPGRRGREGRRAAGGQIVRREYTTDKANDFTAILTNIKGSAPDAIFYGGLDAQSGPMKRQLATLGLKAPLVSGEMTRSDTFIKLAGDAADGTYARWPACRWTRWPRARTSSSVIRPASRRRLASTRPTPTTARGT